MRTSAWVVGLLAVGGCTSNGIFLETVTDDGGTSDTADSGDGTETSPPADSGSDEGPPPECAEDHECDECGTCFEGTCQDFGGCCSALPDEPLQWRCSPPVDCWEDVDCGEGMLCIAEQCVPDPGTMIVEPPLCPGDVVLEVQQLPLAAPLSHAAVDEAGGVRAIDAELGVVTLDLASGSVSPVGLLEGGPARDLLGMGPHGVAAITELPAPDGGGEHRIVRAWGQDDAWSTMASSPASGLVEAAAWSGAVGELWVASGSRIERWEPQGPTLLGEHVLDADVLALAAVDPITQGATLLAVAVADGSVRLLDPATGELVQVSDDALAGRPVDIADHGWNVLVVSAIPADATDEADRTGIHTLQADGVLDVVAPPFGAPGVPLEAAVVEIDGDGVDDLVVANVDGRLDVYLMNADGPRCRMYLPLASILDLEAGDVDGDGARDVLVVDAGPTVTAIHGVAP